MINKNYIEPPKSIYFRACKRCGEFYKTYSKASKYCYQCRLRKFVNALAKNFPIEELNKVAIYSNNTEMLN